MNPTPKSWSHLHPHGQSYLPLTGRHDPLCRPADRACRRRALDQATRCRHADQGRVRGRAARGIHRRTHERRIDPPQFLWPVASSVGDADRAIAAAPVNIERTYTTSDRHHNQMEPHATTAVWDTGGTLTVYETTQHIFGAKELLPSCSALSRREDQRCVALPRRRFRRQGLCLAAHAFGRASRPRSCSGRCACSSSAPRCIRWPAIRRQRIQTIALGAGKDGKLLGIRHESISPTAVFDNYIEYAALSHALAVGRRRRHRDQP